MENESKSTKLIINNQFDYSNRLPIIEYVTYLMKYCDDVSKQMKKLIVEDEERNQQYKSEFRNYKYKKYYSNTLEIEIRGSLYNHYTCKEFNELEMIIKDGKLNNISSLKVNLDLSFRRGPETELEIHEHTITLKFEPYEIIFIRKSNYADSEIELIEKNINEILKKFPVANCIFCTKES